MAGRGGGKGGGRVFPCGARSKRAAVLSLSSFSVSVPTLTLGWWAGQKNIPDGFYLFCCVSLSVCILSNVCPLRIVLARGLKAEPGDVKAGPRQRW